MKFGIGVFPLLSEEIIQLWLKADSRNGLALGLLSLEPNGYQDHFRQG
jgi:hypothetical protein